MAKGEFGLVENGQDGPTRFGEPRVRRASDLVYFAQAKQLGFIKIGVASDLDRRISNLRTGCPDELALLGIMRPERDAREVEQRLHMQFRGDHHHGEWFSPSAALLDYIALNSMHAKLDGQAWDLACMAIGPIAFEIDAQPA